MPAEERRQKIYELIREDGSARVSVLSELFGVTEPTIRADLERLEQEGLVIRDHGGAYLRGIDDVVRSQVLHHREHLEAKRLIGSRAASFVSDADTLILDSGSTATELVRNLLEKRNLHIVTNALNIALIVGAIPSFSVHVTGGEFKAPTLSLTGEDAAAVFHRVFVGKLFLATAGISLESGLSYPSLSDLPVKRAMIGAAKEVYLLADSSKIGTTSFATLGCLDSVDVLITDSAISPKQVRQLEEFGIRVDLAD